MASAIVTSVPAGNTLLHFPMIAGIVLLALGLKKTIAHVEEPLKLVPAVATLAGTATYLLAHVMFRWRNVHRFSLQRLACAIVLVALVPAAIELPALATLGILAVALSMLIAYETVQFRELRDRLRHQLSSEVSAPPQRASSIPGVLRFELRPSGHRTPMPCFVGPVPTLPLRGGAQIPQLGFGVFLVPPEDTADVTTRALLAGYRHIDTAAAYENEAGVGQAVRASGLDRGDVFITTKCFNDDHGYEPAKQAFKASLDRLEVDYVDLYLIHWPVPAHDRYVETWRAFVELQTEGFVRAIGVSNFQPAHLDRIIEETGVTPAVNQIELHPRFQQDGLRRRHEELDIVTEAWSPLAQGQVLDDPAIEAIAEAHGKTSGQVVLRWHLQIGNVVFPKSVTPARIEENFDVFGFQLSDADMEAIAALDAGERIGPDPDTFVRP